MKTLKLIYPLLSITAIFTSCYDNPVTPQSYGISFCSARFNWIQQALPNDVFTRRFSFVNDSAGWVVGGGGQIFKTANGGAYFAIHPNSSIIPNEFVLEQNYPNPFNNQTIFGFQITADDFYKFEIYDITGRLIQVVFKELIKKGKYEVKFAADEFASGTYFYRLSSSQFMQTKKFTLIK